MGRSAVLALAAVILSPALCAAQPADPLVVIQQRLDALEQQNAELRDQLRALQEQMRAAKETPAAPDAARLDALEEKVDLEATRLTEHDMVKAESAQRIPLRLTGVLLFNAFRNSKHANPARDDPYFAAAAAAATPNGGGSLRQSLLGFDLHTPQAILGGEFHASTLFDIFAIADIGAAADRPLAVPINTVPRLRTAWVEGRWGSRSVLVGLANTIVSPREPSSLAQVFVPPLSGAGNLYGWREQIRFDQRAHVSDTTDVRGQVAFTQTVEDWPRIPTAFQATLEPKRPAFEARLEYGHGADGVHSLEFGSAYHHSDTHIAGLSIPSRMYSVDWFVHLIPRIEVSGMAWVGKNVGNLAGRNPYSFSIVTVSPGVLSGLPIRAYGGWNQVAFQATRRLKVHVYGGIEDPNDSDTTLTDAPIRNLVGVANTFFQVAPNVVTGFELSQIRTWYKAGQRPRLNHVDLYVAYVF